MASRGRGRRGRQRSTPLVIDQHAFIEAMGVAAATFAQASATKSQGSLSNLQRFIAHHPPTFTRGGSSGSCSLVMTGGEDFRGYRDHLRCYADQASQILARG